jgi:hypothetical protein
MDVTPVAGKHGLAPNSVVAVEVVTADGAVRPVCDYDEPKVFWALRGGGGMRGPAPCDDAAVASTRRRPR